MIAIPPESDAGLLLRGNPLLMFQQVDVFWEKPGLPSTFFYPFIVVSITTSVEGELKVLSKRTFGGLKFHEVFIDLLEQIIHPSLRPLIERPLFNKFNEVVNGQEFKYQLERFLHWVERQPITDRQKLITIAKNTSGTQILG